MSAWVEDGWRTAVTVAGEWSGGVTGRVWGFERRLWGWVAARAWNVWELGSGLGKGGGVGAVGW